MGREYFDLIGPSITHMNMIGLNQLIAFWKRDFEYAPWLRYDINYFIIGIGCMIVFFEYIYHFWHTYMFSNSTYVNV